MPVLWMALLASPSLAQDATADAVQPVPDSVEVTRWLSHVANDAVLHGRWDGNYDDGHKPGVAPVDVTGIWLPAPKGDADTRHRLDIELPGGALWTVSGLTADQLDNAKVGTWTVEPVNAELAGGQVALLALDGVEAAALAWPSGSHLPWAGDFWPTRQGAVSWPSTYWPTYASNIAWPSTYWPTAAAEGGWPSTYWPTFKAEVTLADGSKRAL